MADLLKMVEVAREQNSKEADSRVKKMAGILAAAGVSPVEQAPIPHPSQLQLVDEDEDPFGGNINNRNVARRIAGQREKVWSNHSLPIHTGDPKKARQDIAKSEAINPTPRLEEEPDEQRPLPMPQPGSPAALRAAAEARKGLEASKVPEHSNAAVGGAGTSVTGPPVWTPPVK